MKLFGKEDRPTQTNKISQVDALRDLAMRAIVVLLICAVAFLLWRLSETLMAAFSSVVIAIAWRGAARPIVEQFKISYPLSLLAVLLIFLISLGLLATLFGNHLLRQCDELALDIPASVGVLKEGVEAHPWGRFLENFVAGVDISKATAPIAMHIASFISSLSHVLVYAVFILLGGAYLAIDPDRHINGLIAIAPESRKGDIRLFLDRSGAKLRRWLYGNSM